MRRGARRVAPSGDGRDDPPRRRALFPRHAPPARSDTAALVIATGGLSIPKIGATDFAYRARQAVRPQAHRYPSGARAADLRRRRLGAVRGAVGLVGGGGTERRQGQGARRIFSEDLLLTHRGLSGPGVLQISSYWNPSEPIQHRSAAGRRRHRRIARGKGRDSKQADRHVSRRTRAGAARANAGSKRSACPADARLADLPDKTLRQLGESLSRWTLTPNGTEGYRKAEVTRGGVDTRELSSTTMMSARVPGLYFIGEAVDVTGWLGGYNFQWAWASGVAAGQSGGRIRSRAWRCKGDDQHGFARKTVSDKRRQAMRYKARGCRPCYTRRHLETASSTRADAMRHNGSIDAGFRTMRKKMIRAASWPLDRDSDIEPRRNISICQLCRPAR